MKPHAPISLSSLASSLLLVALAAFSAVVAQAQPASPAVFSKAEEAKKLIVFIAGSGVEGAGIVVHIDDEFIYGVTARHVIMHRGKIPNNLQGRLRTWSEPQPLEVLKGHPRLDLAGFRIRFEKTGKTREDLLNAVPLAALGSSGELNGESDLYTIGHGAGGGWIDSRDPARLASHDVSGGRDGTLRLEHFCPGGHSGGGVFDSHWRLVGMITDNQEPFCYAIPFETVLESLADWGWSYSLAEKHVEGAKPVSRDGDIIVAVVDFDNRSGANIPDIGPAGRDITTSFLFNLPGIRLVTRARLDSVMREIELKPTVGSTQGISRLGQLLDVDSLVTGSVNRYDVERREFKGYDTAAIVDSYTMDITLQIIDVDTGEIRFSRTYETRTAKTYTQASSAPRQFLQLESEMLRTLLKEQAEGDVQLALRQVSSGADTPIAVQVVTYPAGAEVVVGDIFEGQTPLTLHLSIGIHELEIRKAGYRVWRRQVRVEHDMTPVEVRLTR